MTQDLVLLTQTSPIESQLVRTSLEAAGIFCVLQGEHAGSIDPRIGLVEGVRVLVRGAEIEAARELLEEGTVCLEGPDGPEIDGSLCAVHEQPATAACAVCGTFLCSACGTQGQKLVCEDCVERESLANQRPRWPGVARKVVAVTLLLPLFIGLIVLATLLVARAAGWQP